MWILGSIAIWINGIELLFITELMDLHYFWQMINGIELLNVQTEELSNWMLRC